MPDQHDTSVDAARIQFGVLQKMTAQQRLGMAMNLGRAVRSAAEAGVRRRHPDYDSSRVRLAVIRLSLGETLFRQAYPGIEVIP